MPRNDRETVRNSSFMYGRTQLGAREYIADDGLFGGSTTTVTRGTRQRTTNRGYTRTEQGTTLSVQHTLTVYPDRQAMLDIFPTFGLRWANSRGNTTRTKQFASNVSQDVVLNLPAGENLVSVVITMFSDGDIDETA